ncbi:hypothetical protein [Candidatus Symbiopectobacterium sp. NZEC135]|uniref:hypothetical protein n=1 Tax=Candidatus Symbiopectobacterium sp. NZEC135 TaxID=2820471 RepID=UPI002227FE5F|nr:hypothetical protein [Candidatus Symbiopectobacterium sp. NZEC135]MCW2479232.1 hypothetical protein [Candidatus Symbiopectobacterium sp. NZEC135]
MTDLSKERLEKIASWRETYGPEHNVMIPACEAEALAREVLQRREAAEKPVVLPDHMPRLSEATLDNIRNQDEEGSVANAARMLATEVKFWHSKSLYEAPPLPVAPDESGQLLFEPELTDSANAPLRFSPDQDTAWVVGAEWMREAFKKANKHLKLAGDDDHYPQTISQPVSDWKDEFAGACLTLATITDLLDIPADDVNGEPSQIFDAIESLKQRVSQPYTLRSVSFDELRDAVAEMTGGIPVTWRPDQKKGYREVPFMNFNSLGRIVDKFRALTFNHEGDLVGQPYTVPDDVRTEAEHCAFVLEYLSQYESEDIDSDTIDIRGEDENGCDVGCDVSITEYAGRSAKVIAAMLQACNSPIWSGIDWAKGCGPVAHVDERAKGHGSVCWTKTGRELNLKHGTPLFVGNSPVVPIRYMNRFTGVCFTLEQQPDAATDTDVYIPLVPMRKE